MDDLFGHVPQKDELAMAEAPVSRGPIKHTADTIRVLMLEVLGQARAAQTLPWDREDLVYNTGLYPYWAEWLKNGEGDRIMAEFKAELDRLGAPVDQVAVNWRKIWNLAD